MKEKRLDSLDMVKGIGIVLVVIGHSGYVSEGVLTWLASFHMPLFFIVSGMLFAHKRSDREPFVPYLKRRFCGMMIPYVSFSLINLGIDAIRRIINPAAVGQEVISADILQTVSFFGISVLWFLPTIFLGELCLYGLMKKCPVWLLGIIGVASAWVPSAGIWLIETYFPAGESVFTLWLNNLCIALLRVFPALVFLLAGYAAYYLLQKLSIQAVWEIMLGIGLLLLNAVVAFANGRVDLHYLVFHNVWYYYIGACSATFGLILFCRHTNPLGFLLYLGKNSLIIMLTHLDLRVMNIAIHIAGAVSSIVSVWKEAVFQISLYAVLLIGELLLIVLINRFGFFLIGRRKTAESQNSGILTDRNKV
ncbi:MAG: acyltransferase family protein [Lachnospiraceae bacterium]|nr:acyltransferase family protein [Lachnospiraceae bacterium]